MNAEEKIQSDNPTNDPIYLDLDETMITGASLRGKLPETMTKQELIRWLKCRKGASLSGKKAELVQRVLHYIKNGWDRKYLINPDHHKIKIYSEETTNSGFVQALLDNIPPAGYSNNLEHVPLIEDSDIFQYFLVKCDGTNSTAQKHRDKGWIFYKSGKVRSSEFNLDIDEEVMIMRGDVVASFDRGLITSSNPKKKYPVHICLDKHSGTILGARCLCKAGLGGFCNHVAAVLFQVMDCQRAGNKFTPTAQSQTSKLQTWHKPKVVGQACIRFADIDLQSYNYEKDTNATAVKKARVDYKTFDSCPDGQNCVTQPKIEKFAQELDSLGVAGQLVEILKGNDFEPVHMIASHVTPGPSTTATQDTENSEKCCISSFEGTYNVTEQEFDFYTKNVEIKSSQEQQAISKRTVGQSNSEFWMQERTKRITASKFREVSHRSKFPADKLVERLSHPKSFTSTHCNWGKQSESLALAQYKLIKEQEGSTVLGQDLGLIVNPNYSYLGASPDWFVTLKDQVTGFDDNGLVEVKSLSKYANLHPREAASLPDMFFYLESTGHVCLKDNHPYYFQIQGQLNICCLKWCDLVIWTPKGIEIVRIKRDVTFWNDLLPKLSLFYFKHMLPYLAKVEEK